MSEGKSKKSCTILQTSAGKENNDDTLILSRFPIENAFSQRRTQPRQGLEAGERAALRRRRRREARRLRLLAAAPRDERVPGEAPLGAARNEQYIATSNSFSNGTRHFGEICKNINHVMKIRKKVFPREHRA